MTKKTRKSPDKLTKTGKSGVALSEAQLGQATGGLVNNEAAGKKVKIDF